jgi:hypothetical protein
MGDRSVLTERPGKELSADYTRNAYCIYLTGKEYITSIVDQACAKHLKCSSHPLFLKTFIVPTLLLLLQSRQGCSTATLLELVIRSVRCPRLRIFVYSYHASNSEINCCKVEAQPVALFK